ncbi:sigma-70 family RNA polymerase sigma factor [Paenibacillus sp. P26]|nr:sigma-70 family RNA polymerase sigma factor [Paenibacillus sp. P26]
MTEKELFETYNKDVYRTCYFMLQHAADAEDVCQEVFMTVFRHDWRQVEHLKTWLMRVTVNHCLNQLRKDKRLKSKQERLQLEPATWTEKAAETIAEERESALEARYLLRRSARKNEGRRIAPVYKRLHLERDRGYSRHPRRNG